MVTDKANTRMDTVSSEDMASSSSRNNTENGGDSVNKRNGKSTSSSNSTSNRFKEPKCGNSKDTAKVVKKMNTRSESSTSKNSESNPKLKNTEHSHSSLDKSSHKSGSGSTSSHKSSPKRDSSKHRKSGERIVSPDSRDSASSPKQRKTGQDCATSDKRSLKSIATSEQSHTHATTSKEKGMETKDIEVSPDSRDSASSPKQRKTGQDCATSDKRSLKSIATSEQSHTHATTSKEKGMETKDIEVSPDSRDSASSPKQRKTGQDCATSDKRSLKSIATSKQSHNLATTSKEKGMETKDIEDNKSDVYWQLTSETTSVRDAIYPVLEFLLEGKEVKKEKPVFKIEEIDEINLSINQPLKINLINKIRHLDQAMINKVDSYLSMIGPPVICIDDDDDDDNDDNMGVIDMTSEEAITSTPVAVAVPPPSNATKSLSPYPSTARTEPPANTSNVLPTANTAVASSPSMGIPYVAVPPENEANGLSSTITSWPSMTVPYTAATIAATQTLNTDTARAEPPATANSRIVDTKSGTVALGTIFTSAATAAMGVPPVNTATATQPPRNFALGVPLPNAAFATLMANEDHLMPPANAPASVPHAKTATKQKKTKLKPFRHAPLMEDKRLQKQVLEPLLIFSLELWHKQYIEMLGYGHSVHTNEREHFRSRLKMFAKIFQEGLSNLGLRYYQSVILECAQEMLRIDPNIPKHISFMDIKRGLTLLWNYVEEKTNLSSIHRGFCNPPQYNVEQTPPVNIDYSELRNVPEVRHPHPEQNVSRLQNFSNAIETLPVSSNHNTGVSFPQLNRSQNQNHSQHYPYPPQQNTIQRNENTSGNLVQTGFNANVNRTVQQQFGNTSQLLPFQQQANFRNASHNQFAVPAGQYLPMHIPQAQLGNSSHSSNPWQRGIANNNPQSQFGNNHLANMLQPQNNVQQSRNANMQLPPHITQQPHNGNIQPPLHSNMQQFQPNRQQLHFNNNNYTGKQSQQYRPSPLDGIVSNAEMTEAARSLMSLSTSQNDGRSVNSADVTSTTIISPNRFKEISDEDGSLQEPTNNDTAEYNEDEEMEDLIFFPNTA